jgi:hypothetical protein
MFRNPLTKRVFVFVYLTFEFRYLPLHCLRFPCWRLRQCCIYKVGNPIVEFSGVYIEVID